MDEARPIEVLVVDDSAVLRLLLVRVLEEDPALRVVAAVGDGAAALEYLRDRRPQVVVMDMHMPGMDGFEVTRRIMETSPLPIVICSATQAADEAAFTFRMMEAGAVACVQKPASPEHPEFARMAADICRTVRLMSEVKVVRRRAPLRPAPRLAAIPAAGRPAGIRVVGIGASTGGPLAIQTILGGLPADFPVPILLVQHIAPGFLPGFADWLGQTTGFRICIAGHGMEPRPGRVHVAPDDFHMAWSPDGRIVLSRAEPENGLRPSVAHLFRSLAEHAGAGALGVLLTGMGVDGAAELRQMRDSGALTIAQDRESSVVHGMPGEAIRLDAAMHILPLDRIAAVVGAAVRAAPGSIHEH